MTGSSARASHTTKRPKRPTRFAAARLLGLLTTLVTLAVLFWAPVALAFKPPPIDSHVMDTAGVLSPAQVEQVDRKLSRAREQTGFAVVVFVPSSLEGESIEDVAYTTFNTWKVGSAKGDDGVLLVIAPQERKTFIATGKGVGGALTDLQSSHINRDVINPLLRQGQYYEAINRGTSAILGELTAGTPGGVSDPGMHAQRGQPGARDVVRSGVYIVGFILVIVLAIVSPTFRSLLFWMLIFGRGGGGGRGGFGGGGSGYRGGGGSTGGGGSSDDW
ncbi:MAG: TPM domain-containing protein [Polyangiaceae bacterium]|nr:TPM domain-containing protein [Polyangiaceae bacterium]